MRPRTIASRARSDPGTTLLLFTCTGAPAKAFFDGLADYSAKIRSEFTLDGHVYRSTQRVRLICPESTTAAPSSAWSR